MDAAVLLALVLVTVALLAACALFAFYLFEGILTTLRADPPFVPTRSAVAREAVELFGPIPSGSVVYDLGCGDARVLVEIARRNPGIRCVGVERQWIPFAIARWRVRGLPIEIRRGDLYATDLSEATHVYAYLYARVMDRLYPKLARELRPGATVVSLDFRFADCDPDQVHAVHATRKGQLGRQLFVYRF